LSQTERRSYYEDNMPAVRETMSDMQAEMEINIGEHNRKVNEELRNAKTEQERLAFLLSRVSPAAAYKLTAMNLAGTNTSLKKRYEDQMFAFRETYKTYVEEKWQLEMAAQMEAAQQTRGSGGRSFMVMGSGNEAVDTSDTPTFLAFDEPVAFVIRASILDFGLLVVFTAVAFAGAFFAFVRYDVR
jgi:hypothetical protein